MEIEDIFFESIDYELQPTKLGQGTFGTVYIIENFDDKRKYAAKIINNDNFDGHQQMLFLRESLILHKLDHPSIVKFKGINFRSLIDNQTLQPTIITEYLPNGSLKEQLNKEKLSLSDTDWNMTKKLITLIGISDSMRYLHLHGVIHRDLKPENILFDKYFYPRICDFGLSRCFSESLTNSQKLTMTGQIGTPLYMAPELLLGEECYSSSVDVYAFSIIAYEVISGKIPYFELGEKISPCALLSKIVDGYRPMRVEGITDKMWDLLCRCWSQKPEERPSFEQIFNEISCDMSFVFESVDIDEINEYLDVLLESMKSEKPVKEKEIKKDLNEIKSKITMSENSEEKVIEIINDSYSLSNNDLYSGLVSFLGPKKTRNINKTVEDLKKSSEKGNGFASFLLGLLYESGEEIERDINESIYYYEKSSVQKNSKGFHRIGILYNFGEADLKQDYNKAIEYYKKAADMNDPNAMNNIGLLYKNGNGFERNFSKAIEFYQKAAQLGNANALTNLGYMHENGMGFKQDYKKAFDFYQKAAELGDPCALNNLGVFYLNGKGVDEDKSKAIFYFRKSAELGDSTGKKNLKILKKRMK